MDRGETVALARLHPNSREGIKTGERKEQSLFDSFPGIFNWHGKHKKVFSAPKNTSRASKWITKSATKKINKINKRTHHLVDLAKERKSCSEKQKK